MDLVTVFATVILTCVCTIPFQFLVMYIVYSRWILRAIEKMLQVLPSQIREWIQPYIDDKIQNMLEFIQKYIDEKLIGIVGELDDRLKTVNDTVSKSSARFQRTVNQAIGGLDMDSIDLETEEGQNAVRDQIAKSYGIDVAIQSVVQLLQSYTSKKEEEKQKEVSKW